MPAKRKSESAIVAKLGKLVLLLSACVSCRSSGVSDKRDAGSDAASGNVITGTLQETGPVVCITEQIQTIGIEPQCTLVEHHRTEAGVVDENVPSCTSDNLVAPCWMLATNATACPGGGATFSVDSDLGSANPADISYGYKCTICVAGSRLQGCT